jgi:hypothetical protein
MRKKILRQALSIALSERSTHPMHKHFMHWTFIVADEKIIGYDINRFGTADKKYGYVQRITDAPSIIEAGNIAQLHAEFNAWNKYKKFMNLNKKWEIINIRLTIQGKMKNATPCHCCYNYMKSFGCYACYFSTENGFAKMIME